MSATIMIAMMSALISRKMAASVGIAISANCARCRSVSFGPLVLSMCEARWQR
jgi:hypothetical protein